MKIALVEDSHQDRSKLRRMIETQAKKEYLLIEIDEFSDGIELIEHYNKGYDIVYLDIEMAIMDGMTAAEKLRKQDQDVLIVFITNFVQHAIRGYSVSASDFLLKPLTVFNFQEHFKRILKKLEGKEETFLSVKSSNEMRRVNIDNIYYIESQGHYLYLNLKDEVVITIDTMKNMEQKLENQGFFRSNNGYIVNLKYVRGVEKNVVDVGGHKLQISRPRRKAFMEALTDYIGDELT